MIYLNCGNLWTMEYLNKVIELNSKYHSDIPSSDSIKIKSLYGSIAKLTPTARSADRLPSLGWPDIDRYISRVLDHNINIRYTLNQSCIGSLQDFRDEWNSRLRDNVRELHSIGVKEWTITSPLLMALMRDLFPDDLLEVSTIVEITTPEDFVRWKKLGADGVNVSTSINRDFGALKQIVNAGCEVTILANEACLFRCPLRRECYNLSSHNSQRSEELFDHYPFRWCNQVRMDDPVEWVMSRMVLPQWMIEYQRILGIAWFKIAFRTHPYETAIPILEAYMSQDFRGNLVDLWPTIAHLGHTIEPKNITYISSQDLCDMHFLQYFERHGSQCKSKLCGINCSHCYDTYKIAKR